MGRELALKWQKKFPDLVPDIIIPVPSTANTAALAFAHTLGIRYSEGLYKNPFVGRTFIMDNNTKRKKSVRYKLSPQRTEINRKKVMLVDDSIVRGNTSKEIIKMVRENGAKAVYFASACPPVKFPCYYGIDIPVAEDLIAAKQTTKEIKKFLNVDELLYQELEDLVTSITRQGKYSLISPCMACMDGNYTAGKVSQAAMANIHQERKRLNCKLEA